MTRANRSTAAVLAGLITVCVAGRLGLELASYPVAGAVAWLTWLLTAPRGEG